MKTLIVLIGGICLLSTSVKAQTVETKQAKIESKNVVLAKKTPVKLTKKQATSSKSATTKKEEKKIVKKTEDNAPLENYMEREPEVSDFIWSDKANERLELIPKGFMRDNTRNRVMLHARSKDIKEITLDVCEAGIRDSVKMMEEAISNGATLEDFLPKKVDA